MKITFALCIIIGIAACIIKNIGNSSGISEGVYQQSNGIVNVTNIENLNNQRSPELISNQTVINKTE